jgi:uncharacterized membrane protein
MVFLLAVAIIIYFGLAQRVLDRLRLSDRAALLFLIAMIVGGFLPDIPLFGGVSVNLGGGIVPVILVIYLWSKAEKPEISRSVTALLITAVVVYATMKIMPLEPTYNFFLDPLYVIAIIAGVVAYITGRSRRGSFIAGTMAIVLNDIAAQVENAFAGARSSITIGGAGVFDAVVIAGLIALGLAEFVGETTERVSLELRGAEKEGENMDDSPGENSPESEPENRQEE